MALSKNDYKILYQLYEYECINEMKSLTIEKISELSKLSIPKVRKTIKAFKEIQYINEGIPQTNAKTYYIAEKGINKVKIFLEVLENERKNII